MNSLERWESDPEYNVPLDDLWSMWWDIEKFQPNKQGAVVWYVLGLLVTGACLISDPLGVAVSLFMWIVLGAMWFVPIIRNERQQQRFSEMLGKNAPPRRCPTNTGWSITLRLAGRNLVCNRMRRITHTWRLPALRRRVKGT